MKGKITHISVDIIEIKYATGKTPKMNEILKTKSGNYLSVEGTLSPTIVRAVIIKKVSQMGIGDEVTSTKKPLQAPVGKNSLGRVFNVLGETMDGVKSNAKITYKDVSIINLKEKGFTKKTDFVQTGLKVLDFFLPTRKGDKIGIFGGAGVGKTLVIKEIINNTTKKREEKKNANAIMVGIGERSREGQELYSEIVESELLDQVVLFFAQMNETPGARMKLIYSAITNAEYFRDDMKEDVVMFIDNVFRYVQAGSELSSSLGNMPSESGYQPTLFTEISNVQERLSNSMDASITSFQTVFVPADDITDPSTVNIFSYLDNSMVLDRTIASAGRYPAVSILESNSQNIAIDIIGERHFNALIKARKTIQRYKELEYIIAILGSDGLSVEDSHTVERAKLLQCFFTQNMFIAEKFTHRKGDWVSLTATIESVEMILNGEVDGVDHNDLMYISTIPIFLRKKKIKDDLKNVKNEIEHPSKKKRKKKKK